MGTDVHLHAPRGDVFDQELGCLHPRHQRRGGGTMVAGATALLQEPAAFLHGRHPVKALSRTGNAGAGRSVAPVALAGR